MCFLLGYLHFAYARPEDNLDGRSYRCTTYNPYLDIKAGGNYTQVTVTRSKKIFLKIQSTSKQGKHKEKYTSFCGLLLPAMTFDY